MKWSWIGGLLVSGMCLGGVGCGPSEIACPDPAKGEVDEACGVWVSASQGNDNNPGTRAEPVASLEAAAAIAYETQRTNVYACGHSWTGPLVLPRSVSLYGGSTARTAGRTAAGRTARS